MRKLISTCTVKVSVDNTTGWSWDYGQLWIRNVASQVLIISTLLSDSQQVSFQDEQVNLSEVILGFSRASWLTVVLSDHSGFISIQLHSFLIANLYFVPILFFFLLMLPPDSFLKSNILASVAVPPMLFT